MKMVCSFYSGEVLKIGSADQFVFFNTHTVHVSSDV